MEKNIAGCGLDCGACEARIATLNNDHELRAKLAARMQIHYKDPTISAEMINCTGCRGNGAIMWYCEQCEIRKCFLSKSFQTCADCNEIDDCLMIRKIHQYDPETRKNLKKG